MRHLTAQQQWGWTEGQFVGKYFHFFFYLAQVISTQHYDHRSATPTREIDFQLEHACVRICVCAGAGIEALMHLYRAVYIIIIQRERRGNGWQIHPRSDERDGARTRSGREKEGKSIRWMNREQIPSPSISFTQSSPRSSVLWSYKHWLWLPSFSFLPFPLSV